MLMHVWQGQTLDSIGLYFRFHPFAHGMLYVASSRARAFQHMHVFLAPECNGVVNNFVLPHALAL